MDAENEPERPVPLAIEHFRVVMGDTDAARVIYFAAPLHWAERLTTGWMRSAGIALSALFESGFGLPAVHVEASYSGPLRLDDEVEASLWLHRRSDRSVTLRSEFGLVGAQATSVEVLLTQVYVRLLEGGIQAESLPADLVAAIEGAGAAGDIGVGSPT